MKNIRSLGILLITAMIWGFAFVAQRVGADFVGPFTFNGIRFALGAVSLIPVIFGLLLLPRASPVILRLFCKIAPDFQP